MSRYANETEYQHELIGKLSMILPDCFVMKNDPEQYQGIPDLLILFEGRWAMLEVKLSENSPTQPNQPYYVDMFNEMSFAAFIYPENEDEVLEDLLLRMAA